MHSKARTKLHSPSTSRYIVLEPLVYEEWKRIFLKWDKNQFNISIYTNSHITKGWNETFNGIHKPSGAGRALGSSLGRDKRFFSSSSEVHPASYTIGMWFFLSGAKWPGRDADHSSPSSSKIKNVWI